MTLFNLLALQKRGNADPETEYQLVCPILDKACDNYHHWVTEYLTFFQAIKRYERFKDQTAKIGIPDVAPDWMKESLSLLGYRDRDLIQHKDRFVARHVLIPSPRFAPNKNGWKVFSKNALNWVKNRFRNQLPETPEIRDLKKQKHVFISRRDASERLLVNRTRVMTCLNDLGFRKYRLSDLTLLEQVALFSDAEVIVEAHGAGLTNMIFSDDACVFELFPPDESNVKTGPHYYILSEILDFKHIPITCVNASKNLRAPAEDLVEQIKMVL